MKLSKRSLITGGSVLLLLVALVGVGFWAKKSGKLGSLAYTAPTYQQGVNLTGKVVLQNGGNMTDVMIYLDVPTYLLFNDTAPSQAERESGIAPGVDGSFTLSNMPLGKKMMISATNGISDDDLMVTTPTTEGTTVDIGTFTLNGASTPGTITINAKDKNGVPIASGHYTLTATYLGNVSDLTGTLNTLGSVTFNSVLPGTYKIVISNSVYNIFLFNDKESFQLNPGQNLVLDLKAQ